MTVHEAIRRIAKRSHDTHDSPPFFTLTMICARKFASTTMKVARANCTHPLRYACDTNKSKMWTVSAFSQAYTVQVKQYNPTS
eukprot:2235269-Rhodomonas_salina.1